MKMFFSKTTAGFYAEGISLLPDDAKEIETEVWQSLLAGQADGKIIDFSTTPPSLRERVLTHDDEIKLAEQQKQLLIEDANNLMNFRQWPGKAVIGRLKGDELAQYGVWLDYLDALEAVDSSSVPIVSWPTPPAEQAN
ncbi:tail fiber assembly protein [Erwinia persicina]|uniref:tail fiber assembly protein n=1 Tax=Erwinia persicina TaxID=55211 RepID=UPI001780E7E4|nr:tail fiber assembly protein [Erwinia persicina]MBD8162169.1 tail fiber assembly protein [Erwinia persicina]